MAVIDIDAHFEPGPSWLESFPELAAQIPPIPREHRLAVAFDSLLTDVPRDEWPPLEALAPPGLAVLIGEETLEGYDETASMFPVSDAATRIGWLDEVGIDLQNIICLEGLDLSRNLTGQLRQQAIHACNAWLADATAAAGGRLMPVTALDMSDVDDAVAELTKMRERGSRAFLIQGTPVDGIPPMHPRFDPLWRAATDLGMVAMLHVGYAPPRFDRGWANTAGDMYAFRALGGSQTHQAPQVLLNAMVFGGVFERHPNLTLLLCELNIGWLPYTVAHMDSRLSGEMALFTGKYPYSLLPSEFIRRNVRITPVPRTHQSPIPLFDVFPESVAFSSDYPHFEGSPKPTEYYREHLAGVDGAATNRFMGGNMLEAYKRMGDPLPVSDSPRTPA